LAERNSLSIPMTETFPLAQKSLPGRRTEIASHPIPMGGLSGVRVAVAALLTLCAAGNLAKAGAAELIAKNSLTLDGARQVIRAAEDKAQQEGWPCAVAVVDASGYLIALDRMDASPMLASVELAPEKARTAALFGKPSKALEDAIHAGRVAATTAGFVEMDGGLPLLVDGKEVGAVGVSSAQPDWGLALAAAGAATLSKSKKP
jgi:glc operon protein GlcG